MRRTSIPSAVLAGVFVVAVYGVPANAVAVTLSAVDSGFVTSAGGSAKGDGTLAVGATYNYSVGYELHYATGALGMPPGSTPLAAMDKNNYFVFDLSSLGAPILTATLLLPAGTLESVDGVETFDVVVPAVPMAALGDAGTLMMAHAAGSTAFDSPMDSSRGSCWRPVRKHRGRCRERHWFHADHFGRRLHVDFDSAIRRGRGLFKRFSGRTGSARRFRVEHRGRLGHSPATFWVHGSGHSGRWPIGAKAHGHAGA